MATGTGQCCILFLGLGILSIGANLFFSRLATVRAQWQCLLRSPLLTLTFVLATQPNGELRQWYMAEMCYSPNASFAVTDRGTYDAYLLRPQSGWEPGSACPSVVSAAAISPIEISLEELDGWRKGGYYSPVFALPTGSYATMAFEILDADGAALLEPAVYNLGPDAAYPWTAPTEAIMTARRPDLGCDLTCSDACPYKADGVCDDGGEGAEYAICLAGSDCTDCSNRCDDGDEGEVEEGEAATPPSPPSADASRRRSRRTMRSRRLLFGAVVTPFEEAAGAMEGAMEGATAGAMAGAMAEPVAAPVAAPGARRLLKGGSGGGGRVGSGGRASTTGAGAWGAARPSRTSYVAGASVAMGSRNYGGRSSYTVAGRRYYGGSRPYSYFYGRSAIFYGTALYVVGYGGHGCYSCAHRTCYSCDSCGSRAECGSIGAQVVSSNLDRYQLELSFAVPGGGSPKWPLQLRVINATVFIAHEAIGAGTGSAGASSASSQAFVRSTALYLNFFTTDGDAYDTISGNLGPLGWLLTMFTVVFILCNKQSLFPESGGRVGPVRGMAPHRTTPPHHASYCNRGALGGPAPYCQSSYGQSSGFGGQRLGAYPSGSSIPLSTLPPQQSVARPVATAALARNSSSTVNGVVPPTATAMPTATPVVVEGRPVSGGAFAITPARGSPSLPPSPPAASPTPGEPPAEPALASANLQGELAAAVAAPACGRGNSRGYKAD